MTSRVRLPSWGELDIRLQFWPIRARLSTWEARRFSACNRLTKHAWKVMSFTAPTPSRTRMLMGCRIDRSRIDLRRKNSMDLRIDQRTKSVARAASDPSAAWTSRFRAIRAAATQAFQPVAVDNFVLRRPSRIRFQQPAEPLTAVDVADCGYDLVRRTAGSERHIVYALMRLFRVAVLDILLHEIV